MYKDLKYSAGISLLSGQTIPYTTTITPALPTASSSIYCSLVGLDIEATTAAIDMGLEITCSFYTSTDIDVFIKNISPLTLTVYVLSSMIFAFNNAQLATATPTAARYTRGIFSSSTGVNSNLLWSNALVRSFNTLVGLSSFRTIGSNFDYTITLNNGSSVTAASASSWTKFGFNLVVF